MSRHCAPWWLYGPSDLTIDGGYQRWTIHPKSIVCLHLTDTFTRTSGHFAPENRWNYHHLYHERSPVMLNQLLRYVAISNIRLVHRVKGCIVAGDHDEFTRTAGPGGRVAAIYHAASSCCRDAQWSCCKFCLHALWDWRRKSGNAAILDPCDSEPFNHIDIPFGWTCIDI